MGDPRENTSEETTYGSGQWSLDDLRATFEVELDPTRGMSYIKEANKRLSMLHHAATFELSRAAELLSAAKKVWSTESDHLNSDMADAEKGLASKDKLTVDQRKSIINRKLAPLLTEMERAQNEVDQWNRILEHLKYVAKRADTSTIVESVEAKLLQSM